MHLLMFEGDYYPSKAGGARTRWEFSKDFVKRGHQLTVITPHQAGLPRHETVANINIYRPFKTDFDFLPASLSLVSRSIGALLLLIFGLYLCWDRDIDILHCTTFSMHWAAKSLSKVKHLPLLSFVGYTASINSQNESKVKILLEKISFKLFMGDRVLCRNKRTRTAIEKAGNEHVEVVHGILNEDKIHRVTSEEDTDCQIDLIFVGRLYPVKNPLGAIRLIDQIESRYNLTIIGDGPLRSEVLQEIENRDLNDRVELVGKLDHEVTLKKIAEAGGLILTSHAESYSAVTLEALALGTPVFTRPVGVAREISHPNLYTGEINDLIKYVDSARLRAGGSKDSTVLGKYSIVKYTDAVIANSRQMDR